MITPKVHHVKAKIVTAGITMRQLAQQARMPYPTLSVYVSGRWRLRDKQDVIAAAFRRLTGQKITDKEFWGELLTDRHQAQGNRQ